MDLIDRIAPGFARLVQAINAVNAKVATAGGGGAGTGEIDFGAFPGNPEASLVIIGQAGIVAGSSVTAWIVAKDTADHSADEHRIDPPRLACGNIVPGLGFTIYGLPLIEPIIGQRLFGGQIITSKPSLPYGRWSLAWRWQ